MSLAVSVKMPVRITSFAWKLKLQRTIRKILGIGSRFKPSLSTGSDSDEASATQITVDLSSASEESLSQPRLEQFLVFVSDIS